MTRLPQTRINLRVLFLTSNLGFGHTRAAAAIEKELAVENDLHAEYLDLWSLMDDEVAGSVKDGYLRMATEHPDYYQKLYDLDVGLWQQISGEAPADAAIKAFLSDQRQRWFPERSKWFNNRGQNLDRALINTFITLICAPQERRLHRVLLRSILLLMREVLVSRLRERIARYDPDVVVATQMYPAALFANLKKKQDFRDIPSIGVITDYGLHTAWVRPQTDFYCVACDELVDSLAKEGVSKSRIRVTGIPLMPHFRHTISEQGARRQLGLDVNRRTILVTGGQYGIGIVKPVADLLRSHPGYQVLVTTGSSAKETLKLRHLEKQYPSQLKVFGWVEDMSKLLCAADVVVGKPGGLSVSEALACGRPFLATCCLGGQERHNVDYLRRSGMGDLVELDRLPAVLESLFVPGGDLANIKLRAFHMGKRDAAANIAQLVKQVWLMRHQGRELGDSAAHQAGQG
ncbi:MGDG synthase family glycosyltransferase [Gilvimarinus sp. F26214L]|uniref:MGDG synthase family glycosyltransferase n=1 Tax=Gilvimarinus sp. DZF01 TaxID=3461371 RepID=UPI004045C9B5